MGDVVVDPTVSLDGFIAGRDDGAEFPLGLPSEDATPLRYRVVRD